MKIIRDLKRNSKEAYEYGVRRVKVQNTLNSLNFFTGSTPIFDETDKL